MTTTAENVVDYLKQIDDPAATTTEVSEAFDVSQQAAYRQLRRLADAGEIQRKKVGARAVIWWIADDYSMSANSSDT